MKIKVERMDEKQLREKGVFGWPIWTCEPSQFSWHYDAEEICYVLEGEIRVKTADGEVAIGPGDFVTFPQGLDCVWNVTKPVRKHYTFK